jgi:hypothetical protein
MSRSELVDAYLSGVINRQTFIRGLIGHGLAASVAAAYAVALLPNPARGAGLGADFYDFYPDPTTSTTPRPAPVVQAAPPKKKKKKKRKKKNKNK